MDFPVIAKEINKNNGSGRWCKELNHYNVSLSIKRRVNFIFEENSKWHVFFLTDNVKKTRVLL